MREAAAGLLAAYPDAFTREGLEEHIDDLIGRFRNSALGDTVYRVGRDIHRKLGRDDRVIGAMRLCRKHGAGFRAIASAAAAAFFFRAADENGSVFPMDETFHRTLREGGPDRVFREVCGLDADDPSDAPLIEEIGGRYREYAAGENAP